MEGRDIGWGVGYKISGDLGYLQSFCLGYPAAGYRTLATNTSISQCSPFQQLLRHGMWYFLKIGDPWCHGKKGENEGIKVAVGRQKGDRRRLQCGLETLWGIKQIPRVRRPPLSPGHGQLSAWASLTDPFPGWCPGRGRTGISANPHCSWS